MVKTKIRKEILKIRSEISKQKLTEASHSIFEKLTSLDIWMHADYIYAYMDTKNEIMTRELIELAWSQGKRVAVPKVCGKDICFYIIESFSQCRPGYFGIEEPIEGLEEAKLEDVLVIVPGVAFDKECCRIGYGKGFYDRYLSQHKQYTTAAIAGEWQLVEEVPYEDTDVRLDYLITNDRIIENKSAKKE